MYIAMMSLQTAVTAVCVLCARTRSTACAEDDPPDSLAYSGEERKARVEVWRRYSEFEVLRSFLSIVYPHVSVTKMILR